MTHPFPFHGSLAQYWEALYTEYQRLTAALGQPPFEFKSPNLQTIQEYVPKNGDEIIIYFWDKEHKRTLLVVEAELLPDEDKEVVQVVVFPQSNSFEEPGKSAMATWKEIKIALKRTDRRSNLVKRKQSAGSVTNYYIAGGVNTGGGDFTGRDKSISAGDSSVVVGGNMSGNLISGNYNKINSAQIDPELKDTMLQLAEAVNAMIQKLPIEQAAEIAEDFGKLTDEAVKPKPNRKWYSISIEGLIKAAENLDKLGEPVINLSRKVLSLLTGGVVK